MQRDGGFIQGHCGEFKVETDTAQRGHFLTLLLSPHLPLPCFGNSLSSLSLFLFLFFLLQTVKSHLNWITCFGIELTKPNKLCLILCLFFQMIKSYLSWNYLFEIELIKLNILSLFFFFSNGRITFESNYRFGIELTKSNILSLFLIFFFKWQNLIWVELPFWDRINQIE